MQKKATFILIGVLTLSAVGVCVWLVKSSRTWDPGWGQGELKVSERTYYAGRVTALVDTWRDTAYLARRVSDGRIEDAPFTCLVVDTAGRRVWLESDGQLLPGYEAELPSRVDWRLHRSTPEGMAELASLVRFRIHGVYTNRLPLEQIFLVGTRGRQEHLYFSFSPSGSCHSDYRAGPLEETRLTWTSSPQQAPGEERYESIVVSDAEYEQAKARFKPGDVTSPEPAALRENRAAWTRVEKRLCQEIERQVSAQGLLLQTLDLTCGPDYTAASADLRAGRSGLLSAVRRGPTSAHVYLQIDRLGDDVWYARSAQHPYRPMPARMSLDMEFLLSATGEVAKENPQKLLADGRRKQQQMQSPQVTKWRADLPNGAAVEFVGICKNPSGGRQWWGPDGSPLGFAPYLNYERYGPEPEDRTVYEIVWRVDPPQQTPSGTRSMMEGVQGSYDRQVRDRYGNRTYGTLRGTGYSFERTREKTTLRIGVNANNGPFDWVTFKNISLVPGKDMGFEIVQGGDDSELEKMME